MNLSSYAQELGFLSCPSGSDFCAERSWCLAAASKARWQRFSCGSSLQDSSTAEIQFVSDTQSDEQPPLFYEHLAPQYRPSPDEELVVADLLRSVSLYSVVSLSTPRTSGGALLCSSELLPQDSSTYTPEESAISWPRTPKPELSAPVCPPLSHERKLTKRKRQLKEEHRRKKVRTQEIQEASCTCGRLLAESTDSPSWRGIEAGSWSLDGLRLVDWERRSWRAFQMRRIIMQPETPPVSSLDAVRATLFGWHASLELEFPWSCVMAMHIFQRSVHTIKEEMKVVRQLEETVLLAVSLWVAVKLTEITSKIPRASAMAATAGVPVKLLSYAELHLLDSIGWKVVRY